MTLGAGNHTVFPWKNLWKAIETQKQVNVLLQRIFGYEMFAKWHLSLL